MTSGASLELSTWLAVERICSKLLSSYSTVAPVSSSKISMALFQAMPTSLSVPSKCQSFRVLGSDCGSVRAAGEQGGRRGERCDGADAALGDSHGAISFRE